ncbi:MAG: glycosyltransferase family 4 protein [Muribaculaceae bacterium]|nr:glycosyltransferase family 4 protein [Muribaculaceae bacterium]
MHRLFHNNECFPLVILEAMQQAVPVISTEEGGIPDIIKNGETGLIVKSKSSEDLAKAISLLLDNPDFLVKLGKSSYEMFKSKFTHIQFERNIINCLAD